MPAGRRRSFACRAARPLDRGDVAVAAVGARLKLRDGIDVLAKTESRVKVAARRVHGIGLIAADIEDGLHYVPAERVWLSDLDRVTAATQATTKAKDATFGRLIPGGFRRCLAKLPVGLFLPTVFRLESRDEELLMLHGHNKAIREPRRSQILDAPPGVEPSPSVSLAPKHERRPPSGPTSREGRGSGYDLSGGFPS